MEPDEFIKYPALILIYRNGDFELHAGNVLIIRAKVKLAAIAKDDPGYRFVFIDVLVSIVV